MSKRSMSATKTMMTSLAAVSSLLLRRASPPQSQQTSRQTATLLIDGAGTLVDVERVMGQCRSSRRTSLGRRVSAARPLQLFSRRQVSMERLASTTIDPTTATGARARARGTGGAAALLSTAAHNLCFSSLTRGRLFSGLRRVALETAHQPPRLEPARPDHSPPLHGLS